MFTIDELLKDLQKKKGKLIKAIDQSTEVAINDAIQVIQSRVQEQGIDGDGKAFKPYSESYKKFKKGGGKTKRPNREGNGLVNLTYTGEMFRSIGIVNKKNENEYREILIGGRDKEAEDKIKWNSKERPFLNLSDAEVAEISEDWGKRIIESKELIFK